ADAVDEVLATDRVEDHLRASPVRQFERPLDEVLARIVDPMIEPELPQALELLVARGGAEHRRAGLLGELDRGHAHAPGAGVDQGRLSCRELPGCEQAFLGGRKRDRYRGGASRVEAV